MSLYRAVFDAHGLTPSQMDDEYIEDFFGMLSYDKEEKDEENKQNNRTIHIVEPWD